MGYSDSKSTKNSGGILIFGFLNGFVNVRERGNNRKIPVLIKTALILSLDSQIL